MIHRREIDGLRAVAVIPVLLFHAGFEWVSGGYVGVDVFFVISGYLIAGIISEDLDAGRFSLSGFYERRIRRILPALFLVLSVCIIIYPLAVFPDDDAIADFGTSVIAVVFFLSNFLFWLESGYFGSANEMTPLLHTWSLAVEEQYYLLFPLLLLLLIKSRWLLPSLTALTLLSLLLAEWGWRQEPQANFFLTPSRIWELLLGALLMIWQRRGLPQLSARQADVVTFAGLALIIASCLMFRESSPHPGFLTLLPTLGTAFLLAYASEANLAGRLLANRLPAAIGLISYSLYLWHQPVLVVFRNFHGPDLDLAVAVLALLFSLIISYLAWRFVEVPCRNRSRFTRNGVFGCALAASLVLLVLGFGLRHNLDVQRVLWPEQVAEFDVVRRALDREVKATGNICHFLNERVDNQFRQQFRLCAEKFGPALLVIGDSHGIDLFNAFSFNSTYPFIAAVVRGYCRAHDSLGGQSPSDCPYEDLRRFVRQQLTHIGVVIYTQTPDRLFNRPMRNATEQDLSADATRQVADYLESLRRSGARVEMFGMLPPISLSPRAIDVSAPLTPQLSTAVSPRTMSLVKLTDDRFRKLLASRDIPYRSKLDLFALSLPDDLIVEGEITYSDPRHISLAGARIFGSRMMIRLESEGFLDQMNQ